MSIKAKIVFEDSAINRRYEFDATSERRAAAVLDEYFRVKRLNRTLARDAKDSDRPPLRMSARTILAYMADRTFDMQSGTEIKNRPEEQLVEQGCGSADPRDEDYMGHNKARELGLAKCICNSDPILCPFHGR